MTEQGRWPSATDYIDAVQYPSLVFSQGELRRPASTSTCMASPTVAPARTRSFSPCHVGAVHRRPPVLHEPGRSLVRALPRAGVPRAGRGPRFPLAGTGRLARRPAGEGPALAAGRDGVGQRPAARRVRRLVVPDAAVCAPTPRRSVARTCSPTSPWRRWPTATCSTATCSSTSRRPPCAWSTSMARGCRGWTGSPRWWSPASRPSAIDRLPASDQWGPYMDTFPGLVVLVSLLAARPPPRPVGHLQQR